MAFTTTTRVRFAHVDAAAILFYPRYFEMLNGAVEDWFADMRFDFRTLHVEQRIGVPTVKLECEFVAPSELGELLTVELTPKHIGRSSCLLDFRFSGNGRDRAQGSVTLVCMDLATQSSTPWPEPLRTHMHGACEEART